MTHLVVHRPDGSVLSGGVNAGESVGDAVDRILDEHGSSHVYAYAVDLSGPELVFAWDTDIWVAFRPMSRADLRAVVRWQHAPHVARWWDEQATDLAAAENHYGRRIDGDEPTRMWVIELNGRSVGFIQDYRIGDHPEYAVLTAQPDAVAVDYAIGDPAWVGKGIGTRVMWNFLRNVVRRDYPLASTYFAAPDHRNLGSRRMLEKLGFVEGLWFDEPKPEGRVDTVVSYTLDVRTMFG